MADQKKGPMQSHSKPAETKPAAKQAENKPAAKPPTGSTGKGK